MPLETLKRRALATRTWGFVSLGAGLALGGLIAVRGPFGMLRGVGVLIAVFYAVRIGRLLRSDPPKRTER